MNLLFLKVLSLYCVIFAIFLSFVGSDIESDGCNITISSTGGVINWEGDPSEALCEIRRWRVTITKGGGAQINVTKVNMDDTLGNYLLITPGLEPDLFIHDEFTPILISNKETIRLVIFYQSEFSILINTPQLSTSSVETFALNFAPYFEHGPTTSTTTIKPTLPGDPEQSAELFVKNTSPSKLIEIKDEFRDVLVQIMKEYCNAHNYVVPGVINRENVTLWDVKLCEIDWPDWENCARVIVSIENFTKSQVISAWNEFGNKFLQDLDLAIYDTPLDTETNFWLWIGVSGAIILLLLLIIFGCYGLGILYRLEMKQNNKRSSSLLSSRTSNASQDSWFPSLAREDYNEEIRTYSQGHQWTSAELEVPEEVTNNMRTPPTSPQDSKNFTFVPSSPSFGAATIFFSSNDPVYDLPEAGEKDA